MAEKPPKEVLVVQDEGEFHFKTGDKYVGFFEAKKKDRSAKMHGPGTYTTAQGDSYSGNWDYDNVGTKEEAIITFADHASYYGFLKDWMYSGPARYTYPDGSFLDCTFAENCPTDGLRLTDPNGHTWAGAAEQGFAWLLPGNHYYQFLEQPVAERLSKRKDSRSKREA